MNVPREFAINGSIWYVEHKWGLTYNKSPVDGLCDPSTKIVYIDRSLSKEDKWWTFVHEWIHAVVEEYRIGHNHGGLTTDQEDELITTLETELKRNFSLKWKRSR